MIELTIRFGGILKDKAFYLANTTMEKMKKEFKKEYPNDFDTIEFVDLHNGFIIKVNNPRIEKDFKPKFLTRWKARLLKPIGFQYQFKEYEWKKS